MNPPDPQTTVLLVDDEPDLLEVFTEALRPYFQTDRAGSAKEAEALLKIRKYKVIVSDHSMPGGDGLSLLARVRKHHPDTVRLLVTSYLDPKFMASLGQAEPYRYLLKPVSIPQLVKAIQDAVRHHDQNRAGT